MLNYRDIRGANSDEPDGKIDDNDKEWIIKHTKSPINYGFSVGGAWKGLSVDLFFQGVAGGKRFYDQRTEWEGMEASAYAWRADYWTPENTDAKFPKGRSRQRSFRRIDFLDSRYFIPALEECEYHLPASTTTGIQMGAFTNEILPDGKPTCSCCKIKLKLMIRRTQAS